MAILLTEDGRQREQSLGSALEALTALHRWVVVAADDAKDKDAVAAVVESAASDIDDLIKRVKKSANGGGMVADVEQGHTLRHVAHGAIKEAHVALDATAGFEVS